MMESWQVHKCYLGQVWYILILPMRHPKSFWSTKKRWSIQQVRLRDRGKFHSWRRYHRSMMTIMWHQRQRILVFLGWHWWELKLRNSLNKKRLWMSFWCKMRLGKKQRNHLLRYMDKMIRYRFRKQWSIWKHCPSNLLNILDFHKRKNKRRVIIQRNLRVVRCSRMNKIQLRRRQRKPNKIHIVLGFWRLGRLLRWPNWRRRLQRQRCRRFRRRLLYIQDRWIWILHWSNQRKSWFLWYRFGWHRRCGWQLLIRLTCRWLICKFLLQQSKLFRG